MAYSGFRYHLPVFSEVFNRSCSGVDNYAPTCASVRSLLQMQEISD